MSPETLFSFANTLALAGWVALLLFPRRHSVNWWLCGVALPLTFALAYAALLAFAMPSAEGGFSTLAGVAALFASPWVLLAGWLHYLAFDLFIGAWMARRATAEGLPRWILWVALPPTFLLGPLGLLVFLGLRRVAR
jgi:hypothetical protein